MTTEALASRSECQVCLKVTGDGRAGAERDEGSGQDVGADRAPEQLGGRGSVLVHRNDRRGGIRDAPDVDPPDEPRCQGSIVWRTISAPTPVRFSQSARRHRIGKVHALHVINTVEPEVMSADDTHRDRLLWIGPDDRGLPLEIVAIVEPDYLLVIHVMPHHFRRSNA